MEVEAKDYARDQAIAQMEHVAEMVAALECDYERLAELKEDRADSSFPSRVIAERLGGNPDHTAGWWEDEFPDEAEELDELEKAAGDCENRDEADRRISEDPLSVEVRSGWTIPGEDMEPEQFRIVLCTGGPHVELVGDLGRYGSPINVRCKYADWGSSGELYDFDHDAALTYCRRFLGG